ncbi:MAG: hypothetical protein CMJ58_13050 [Planctomycetaceae bacterium]|nr:hypothetical protein [Planctomycetaceae bacterium]
MSADSPSVADLRDADDERVPVVALSDEGVAEDVLRARIKERHVTMLAMSVAIIAASFALRFNDSGGLSGGGVALPPLCGSRALFGVECPGCGLSRSFVALAAGDVAKSLQYHRIGWIMAAAVLLQIPYRLLRLRQLRTGTPDPSWPRWFGNLLIALLIGNWVWNVATSSYPLP